MERNEDLEAKIALLKKELVKKKKKLQKCESKSRAKQHVQDTIRVLQEQGSPHSPAVGESNSSPTRKVAKRTRKKSSVSFAVQSSNQDKQTLPNSNDADSQNADRVLFEIPSSTESQAQVKTKLTLSASSQEQGTVSDSQEHLCGSLDRKVKQRRKKRSRISNDIKTPVEKNILTDGGFHERFEQSIAESSWVLSQEKVQGPTVGSSQITEDLGADEKVTPEVKKAKQQNLDEAFIDAEQESCPREQDVCRLQEQLPEKQRCDNSSASDVDTVIPDTQFSSAQKPKTTKSNSKKQSLKQQRKIRSSKQQESSVTAEREDATPESLLRLSPISSLTFLDNNPDDHSNQADSQEGRSENSNDSEETGKRSKKKSRKSASSFLDFSFLEEDDHDMYSQVKTRRRKCRSLSPSRDGRLLLKNIRGGSSQIISAFSQDDDFMKTPKNRKRKKLPETTMKPFALPLVDQGLSQSTPQEVPKRKEKSEKQATSTSSLWPCFPEAFKDSVREFSLPDGWTSNLWPDFPEKLKSSLRAFSLPEGLTINDTKSYSEELVCEKLTHDNIVTSYSEEVVSSSRGRGRNRGRGRGQSRERGQSRGRGQGRGRGGSRGRGGRGRGSRGSECTSETNSLPSEGNKVEPVHPLDSSKKAEDVIKTVEAVGIFTSKTDQQKSFLSELNPLQLSSDDSECAVLCVDVSCHGDDVILVCCSSQFLWLYVWVKESWKLHHRYETHHKELRSCHIFSHETFAVLLCTEQEFYILTSDNWTDFKEVAVPVPSKNWSKPQNQCQHLVVFLEDSRFCVAMVTDRQTVFALCELNFELKLCRLVQQLESLDSSLHSLNSVRGQTGALVGMSCNSVCIWNYESGRLLKKINTKMRTLQCGGVWSENGLLFLPCTLDINAGEFHPGCMMLINPTTEQCCVAHYWSLQPVPMFTSLTPARAQNRVGKMRLCSCKADGEVVCGQAEDGSVWLWSFFSGQLLGVLPYQCDDQLEVSKHHCNSGKLALHPTEKNVFVAASTTVRNFSYRTAV